MEELLAKDEKELPMPRFPSAAARLEEARLDAREDAKWQRRRELMAKVKEQASSEEDENPAAPPPQGSVFTKALKVSEGLYQFSDDQMAGDFPCFDETTATRLRRLQAKDVQRLLRGFEGPTQAGGPGARCGGLLHRQDEVGPRPFLEHPEDPVVSSSLPKAKECSSFWITEEGQLWMEENSLTAISFDQCRLGQLVKKATTLATDLPIQDWDQMRCTHQSHVGTNESSTLSRYPWDMMAGLAKAIAVSLAAPGTSGSPHNFRETLRNHLRGGGRTPRKAIPPRENGDPVKEAVPPHHTRAQSPEATACTGSSTLRQTP